MIISITEPIDRRVNLWYSESVREDSRTAFCCRSLFTTYPLRAKSPRLVQPFSLPGQIGNASRGLFAFIRVAPSE